MHRSVGHGAFRERGFTLLEVLIALTLFAILMAALFGGLRLGTRVWEVSGQHLEQESQLLAVRSFLEQRLEEAMPVINSAGSSDDQTQFAGEPRRLRLTSTMPASLGDRLFFLELSLHQQPGNDQIRDLVLVWQPWPIDAAVDSSERVILDDVRTMSISYFGRSAQGATRQWHDAWENQPFLPELIQLNLAFPAGDRRRWPPLIVSPKIDEWYDTVF